MEKIGKKKRLKRLWIRKRKHKQRVKSNLRDIRCKMDVLTLRAEEKVGLC
ncbi:hypothetical protein ES703_110718 [subsurface metagenome]